MNKKNLLRILTLILTILLICQSSFAKAVLDFDGDGKTDPTVLRGENGKLSWYSLGGRDGFLSFQWGQNVSGTGDQPVPEDYDGDGKWDVAIWRRLNIGEGQSYFYILYSQTNTVGIIPWGLSGDQPVVQDYDGDGKADIAVFRESDGVWYIQQSRDGYRAEKWGKGDDPLFGDYDGDGRADLAVSRKDPQTPRADLTFFIKRSSNGGWISEQFGYQQADYAVPGDYDGDGKTDIAVWRGRSEYGNGTWYWHRSSDGKYDGIKWGLTLTPDFPVQGDYDGDGKTDVAVYRSGRPPQSYFYINGSRNGITVIPWGATNDSSIVRFR